MRKLTPCITRPDPQPCGMAHETPLITTLVTGICFAFLLGLLADRLRLPVIAGYLMAGVVLGPFTPGIVADLDIASQLSEVGVILLMFGVGLHFSMEDLMSVRGIAVAGALAQIAVACLTGMGLGWALGWGPAGGAILGLSLSVASTVVLLRLLTERHLLAEDTGRVAIGWLVMQDLVMVVVLLLIPPLAGLLGGTEAPLLPGAATEVARLGISPIWATLLTTGAKVLSFVALMLLVGRRVIPWVLHYVDDVAPPELFRLAVLAIALGVAYGSAVFFGVTFSLGAFFAGMVMAGSRLATQAMKDTLPLRDAFAVLFFVSVGMLFDPAVLWTEPVPLLATALIILVLKTAAAWWVLRAFGHAQPTALFLAASLAQIGEFSFILVGMSVDLDIIPSTARDLVVAGALLSILVNPLMILAARKLANRLQSAA
jgi:CPA2 family monovalent cation:H+ antiporter-2